MSADSPSRSSRRASPPCRPRRVVALRILRRLPARGRGFLTLTRLLVRNEYEDGRLSRPYRFEMVERRGTDSVALIPFHLHRGKTWILLKAGFRPALFLRGRLPSPGEAIRPRAVTVEAVSGSLEPGDAMPEDIDRRAVAELAEETGFRARPTDLMPLGAGFFPSHGQCTEKIHLRAVRIRLSEYSPPLGDGSVNEADSRSIWIEAQDLLRRCREGEVEDPKVEIGVLRLLESGFVPSKRPPTATPSSEDHGRDTR